MMPRSTILLRAPAALLLALVTPLAGCAGTAASTSGGPTSGPAAAPALRRALQTLALSAAVFLVVVALLSPRRARASDQLPLVIVMVLFTFGGLGLLFGF